MHAEISIQSRERSGVLLVLLPLLMVIITVDNSSHRKEIYLYPFIGYLIRVLLSNEMFYLIDNAYPTVLLNIYQDQGDIPVA